MDHAKKMALVEPRLLEGLQHQLPLPPVVKAMTSLDQDMQSVLIRQELPLDDKVKLYNQVLQRYATFKDQHEAAMHAPIRVKMVETAPQENAPREEQKEPDTIEREVLESIPKTLKKKGQLLIDRVKNTPHLGWNDKGELVYKDQVVENTNVADLIHDVLRRRKRPGPRGWQTFARALKESNVPQELIGHQERWQWMQEGHQPAQETQTRKKKRRVVSTRVPRWTPY